MIYPEIYYSNWLHMQLFAISVQFGTAETVMVLSVDFTANISKLGTCCLKTFLHPGIIGLPRCFIFVTSF